MSLEYFFGGEGPSEFLTLLSACVATVGTEEFNPHFLKLIESVIRADQCTVFSYRSSRPICYLSYNERHKKSAKNLTQKYLRDGFTQDPLNSIINEVRESKNVRVLDFDNLKPSMTDDYLKTYFTGNGMADKISVIAANNVDVIGMNFYRFEENGRFFRSDPKLRKQFWEAIVRIVLLHFSSARAADITSPLHSLSTREKSICEAMLRGLTADAIAWELGISSSTVKTYRRRAYEKLGINSKSALFELCHRN